MQALRLVAVVALGTACGSSSAPTPAATAPPPPPPALGSGSGSAMIIDPAPPPAAASAKCGSDDDCMISCESRGNCCNVPFCEDAETASIATDARAYNQAHCTHADRLHCPVVGGRVTPTYDVHPRCRAGACVAEKVPKSKGEQLLP